MTTSKNNKGKHALNDPYRWMEEESTALRTWVQEQHEYAMVQLSSIPAREVIRRRLEELLRLPTKRDFTQAGNRYFFRQRFNDQELASLYYQDTADAEPQLLLDPSRLSADNTTMLADFHPSCDGSFIAYRLSSSGSSAMSLDVMNVESKEVIDLIPGNVNPVAHAWHTKNRVAWLPDNSGFYYTRSPDALPAGESRFNHKLYFHRLGDDWRNDTLVFGESLKREQTPYPQLSSDGRYLTVVVQDLSAAAPCSELYLLDREDPQQRFVPMIRGVAAFISATTIHRDTLYVQTNHNAPFGKLIGIKLQYRERQRPERSLNWERLEQSQNQERVEQSQDQDLTQLSSRNAESAPVAAAPGSDPLKAWAIAGDYLFVETIQNVSSRLNVHDLAGKSIKQIALPGIGSISGLKVESGDVQFSFSSFLAPKAVYRVDLKEFECNLVHQPEASFDPGMFEVEQIWFESRDQTRIPMFLVHKRGLERDGNNATVIHGYGGFGVSLLPTFTPHVIPFLECGGIYAVVNTRGGGEFGSEWHRAGMRENKQNVFDDFIAAAEWLIANGYTQSSRLGCFGWSNGGLSVQAVAVQRPDLFKAVVAGSAVTDMARFHLAHGGKHWIADYGSPEDPNDLDFLMSYSPYHTLPPQIEAPAILTIAPDNDDRVAPWHSYKMHAAWLAANVSVNPILLREEKQSGHRGSPAASRTIERYADIWSFFLWQLGVRTVTR